MSLKALSTSPRSLWSIGGKLEKKSFALIASSKSGIGFLTPGLAQFLYEILTSFAAASAATLEFNN